MTQEEKQLLLVVDYEKKYKEALEWIRDIYHSLTESNKEHVEHLFPEIKESEDEKIRKAIIELIKQSSNILHPQNQDKMIAYLEKQKDSQQRIVLDNPLSGETIYEREIPCFMKGADPKDVEAIVHLTGKGWTVIAPGKEQQPVEWSEKDEKMILDTIRILDTAGTVPQSNGKVALRFSENILWLKSLRGRFVKEDEK